VKWLFPCLLPLVVLLGCDAEAPGRVEAPKAEPAQYSYSPFVVELSGDGLPFHQISFKDVGMSLPQDTRAFTYETIAESLSAELGSSSQPMETEVRYSEAAADPDNHRHCQGQHIYVDLWHNAVSRAESSSKWGYSLWSGCGADDQFAWRELQVSGPDPVSTVSPLTEGIADSLRDAMRTGCFQREC